MGHDIIHETIIKDISDLLRDGVDIARDVSSSSKGAGYASSITKATKGLVMEFPVLISKANHIESAGIVAKAYEAKFVTLLHMAFAASNITNSAEGIEYLKNFHTNLDSGKLSVDTFIDVMDGFVENSNISADSYAKYRAVTEDMKNLCYCFGEDINESSLNNYKVMNNYGSLKVIKEATPGNPHNGPVGDTEKSKRSHWQGSANARDKKGIDELNWKKYKLDQLQATHNMKMNNRDQARKDEELKLKQGDAARRDAELALKVDAAERDAQQQQLDMLATSQNMITNYIVPSDLKKANELVPTMMVVNFVYQPEDGGETCYKQMVVGVKAKLYEVEPMDVINKVITKHVDSNILLKLVQVNTRQISFVKDFVLAIDSAKIDALSRSKRGSTNKLFKVLERRALGSRAMKTLRMKDYCKAITSLVISQEEAEELKKNNIDVSNPRVIRPIMEQLNLISFAIIDESAEAVRFIWDTGDDMYETIPLSRLEKEQKDGMSKKVINLMAKMNR